MMTLLCSILLMATPSITTALFDLPDGHELVDEVVAIKENHYTLTNRLYDSAYCNMSYHPGMVEEKGAAFTASYTDPDPEEGGLDAYLNGAVGGREIDGIWKPGDYSLTGLPVQVKDLSYGLYVIWNVSQEDALDSNDRWWATINIIFDPNSPPESRPVTEDRLFDIVVETDRFEQDNLEDRPKEGGNEPSRYWYFARYTNGDIRPFELNVGGNIYQFAVRYKFFRNQGWKDDKVHVKFVAVANSAEGVAPYIDASVHVFIDAAVEYFQYVMDRISGLDRKRAEEQFSKLPEKYIKTISAGYEVYQGTSILHQHELRTYTNTQGTTATPPTSTVTTTHSTNSQCLKGGQVCKVNKPNCCPGSSCDKTKGNDGICSYNLI